MFQVNDYVVYGSSGVCKILEIGTPEINLIDRTKLYYTIKPEFTRGSLIYTPVDNDKQILRSIITKEDALMLIDDIPYMDIIQIANDKLRNLSYKQTMRRYNCREWMKLIKTLYLDKEKRLSEGKKFGYTDMKYLQEAEDYLYCEFSIPLGIPREEMDDFIKDRLLNLNAI
jgi:CarD family transcriptional regulator